MPRKKQIKRKDIIITAFKVNLFILAAVLLSYVMLGFFYDPSFFQRDLKSKLAWGADTSSTVTLQITGSPPAASVEVPILDLGGGAMVTWGDILSVLSWLVIFLLGLLILFASLLLLEYLLAQQRLIGVDEYELKKRDFINKYK